MKPRTTSMLHIFVTLLFSFYCAATLAIPKVAENESAPVTTGADVEKPKFSGKQAKPQTAKKNKKAATKKTKKEGRHTKKAKATHRRK